MRRIKDIEAIESDSFVPQAFKSSRDDIKVRVLSLSLPLSLSLSVPCSLSLTLSLFSLCALIEFFHPLRRGGAFCPETAQTKSNIPIQCRLFPHGDGFI